MESKKQRQSGFTLIEILVVMVILSILASIALGNFRTSQMKARDAARKATLKQISNALEAYMNDHAGYPQANSGMIVACGCVAPLSSCQWGVTGLNEFCDQNRTVYMQAVPADPGGSSTAQSYCYWSNGTSYKIYAQLENSKDAACLSHDLGGNCQSSSSCNGLNYNFGLSSTNTTP